MAVVWPASLPQYLMEQGYQEKFRDNRILTPMDVGPPKVRRRGTSAMAPISGQEKLTATQLETLRTYFETTLNDGTDEVEWTHPTKGGTVYMIFAAPPEIEPAGGANYFVSLSFWVKP